MTQDEQAERTSGDETAYEPDPRRWRVLAVSLVVGFMSLLDVTIVNVAVPSIRAGLDTSAATIQWVVSGYALAFGMTLVAGGRLGDAHGRRRMMTDRAHRLHRLQRRRRAGPQRGRHRARPPRPGRQRGPAHPAELRAHPAALPRRRARPRLRDVRLHRGRRLGHRAAHRRPADRPARRGERLALALPHQRAHRPRGAGADPPAGARQPRRRRARGRAEGPPHRPRRRGAAGPHRAGGAVPADQPRGRRRPAAGACWSPSRCWRGRSCGGRRGPSSGAARRCSTCRCCGGLPGYANGLLVGTLYFTGFTGIFLVLSVHLQEGEGFSPLQAALLMTPFAVGAATTSPLAGRLVGTPRPAGDPGRARRDDDRHRARRVAGDLAHRHPVVDPRARRCSSPASAAAG